MSTVPEQNRFAPPTARVEDVSTGGLELAGRGARLGAVLIDGLIQGAIYYAIAFTMFRSMIPNVNSGFGIGSFLIQLLAGIGLFVLIQSYLLATQGQTVGKKLLGLRIVRSNGEAVAIGRMLGLRYFLGWIITMIPFIGALFALTDALLIFRDSRKCLHDNIADTIVVKA
jgi:uncharacterized RDD family membrane protein YckC